MPAQTNELCIKHQLKMTRNNHLSQTIMNDAAITTLLFFGAAITLIGIGIQLFSERKTPENSAKIHSPPVKTNMFTLKLLIFSISIVLIQFGTQIYSSKTSGIDVANHFEGDIREKNK